MKHARLYPDLLQTKKTELKLTVDKSKFRAEVTFPRCSGFFNVHKSVAQEVSSFCLSIFSFSLSLSLSFPYFFSRVGGRDSSEILDTVPITP